MTDPVRSSSLDPGRITEIRERANAATPGPWVCSDRGDGSASLYVEGDEGGTALLDDGRCPFIRGEVRREDGVFAAHARSDIPYLLDLVTSLTQTLGTRQQERDTAQDEAQENWQSVKRLKAQLEGSERQRAALQAALKKLEAEWRAKAEQQRQFCSQSECLNLIGIMADANEARADELQALVRSEGEKGIPK